LRFVFHALGITKRLSFFAMLMMAVVIAVIGIHGDVPNKRTDQF